MHINSAWTATIFYFTWLLPIPADDALLHWPDPWIDCSSWKDCVHTIIISQSYSGMDEQKGAMCKLSNMYYVLCCEVVNCPAQLSEVRFISKSKLYTVGALNIVCWISNKFKSKVIFYTIHVWKYSKTAYLMCTSLATGWSYDVPVTANDYLKGISVTWVHSELLIYPTPNASA